MRDGTVDLWSLIDFFFFFNFDLAGLFEHVLQGYLQANSSSLQSRSCYVVASPRECRA